MNKNRLVNRAIVFLCVLSLVILGRYIYQSRGLIAAAPFSINKWLLCLCTVLFFAGHILYIGVLHKLLAVFRIKMPYLELSRMHFSTLLIKYIPGKIFYPLSKGLFLKKNGAKSENIAFIILFDMFIALISALIVSFISFILYVSYGNNAALYLYSVILISGLLFYISREKLAKIKFFQKKEVATLFHFLPLYSSLVILDGIIFYLFIKLFCPVYLDRFFLIIGINAAFRAIFSVIPNELGIGELIQFVLLRGVLVPPFFALIPLFMRLWKVALEICIFSVLFLSASRHIKTDEA